MQNSSYYRGLSKNWTRKQVSSLTHFQAVIVFGILSISPLPVVSIVVLGISLIAAIMRIPSLILMAIIISFVTAIFPPLSIILSIIFFLMKLEYIARHFEPLFLGTMLIVYLFYSSINAFPIEYLLYEGTFLYSNIYFSLAHFALSAILIHCILFYLYKREYSAKEAVMIMSTVPLFVIMLILPFLLQQIENFDDILEGESFDDFKQQYNTEPSKTHFVNGHIRENADGSTSTVRPHIRTNPDGIESNNLSHKD